MSKVGLLSKLKKEMLGPEGQKVLLETLLMFSPILFFLLVVIPVIALFKYLIER